jgi:cytochrome c
MRRALAVPFRRFFARLPVTEPMMKARYVLLAAAALFAAGAAHAQSAEDLLKKHGCTACHSTDKKLVGPAYKEVANKYKGDAKAHAALEAKVKKGGAGVWGQVPMPPNPQVPDADIKTMITYVLALK